MIEKSLYDISWQCDEPTYRADPAISYSTLAKFKREGFNKLDHIFDRVESPSLTFGSCVDSLLTGGQEEFDSRFFVADIGEVTDGVMKVCQYIKNNLPENSTVTLDGLSNDFIIEATNMVSYQLNWKPETRAKVIREKGEQYFNMLILSDGKTVVSNELYSKVLNCVDALKTSDATRWYFQEDNPFDDIERLYQLKFKGEYEGINIRCMADLIVCDHKNKVLYFTDLKTSSHTEWEFPLSFKDWVYSYQAGMYSYIVRQNMMRDEYFKYFKLMPYRFIVVNKETVTPLVWEFSQTFSEEPFRLGNIEIPNWRETLKELNHYLNDSPRVPDGISLTEPNSIEKYFEK